MMKPVPDSMKRTAAKCAHTANPVAPKSIAVAELKPVAANSMSVAAKSNTVATTSPTVHVAAAPNPACKPTATLTKAPEVKPCYHPKPAAVAASKKTLNPACAEFKPGIAKWEQSNPPVATVAPVAALNLAMTTEVTTYPP